jgi:uncharacterized protein
VSEPPLIDSPDSLFRRIAGQAHDELPPVHLWNPADVNDIGMRIRRDGTWWYQGSPIERERMVRLFSRVLRREGQQYFLVTPVEKIPVAVDAAPLLAVRMEVRQAEQGTEIAFQTNTEDIVVVDRDHPIRVHGTPDRPLPVVVVRDEIEALITRNVYYALVNEGEIVQERGSLKLMVHSRGEAFALGTV